MKNISSHIKSAKKSQKIDSQLKKTTNDVISITSQSQWMLNKKIKWEFD